MARQDCRRAAWWKQTVLWLGLGVGAVRACDA